MLLLFVILQMFCSSLLVKTKQGISKGAPGFFTHDLTPFLDIQEKYIRRSVSAFWANCNNKRTKHEFTKFFHVSTWVDEEWWCGPRSVTHELKGMILS